MKILLVDDEQLDIFITKKLLSLEFDVEGFTSVPDVLNWAKNNTFDVVLIDYYLSPTMHAHDLLQQLNALKKDHPFKAFVLTNFVDDKQNKELMDAGFSSVIHKPLTLEKFKPLL